RHTLSALSIQPPFTQFLYSAALAPTEVLGDVVDPPADSARPTRAGDMLYLVVGPWTDAGPPTGGDWLAPNAMVVSDAAVLGVSSPHGIDRADGAPIIWMGTEPVLVEAGTARDSLARLSFDALPGPALA